MADASPPFPDHLMASLPPCPAPSSKRLAHLALLILPLISPVPRSPQKCVQYSLRTYLYLLTLLSNLRPLSRPFQSNAKRIKLAIAGLSLTRKCLLLLNPLHPLTDLLSPKPMSATTMLNHLIDLLGAVADDIYCLGKLGLVNRRLGSRADEWSK